MNAFKPVRQSIQQMITISRLELDHLLENCYTRTYQRKDLINRPFQIATEVYFVNKGIIRVFIVDCNGEENTIHFAFENQFIADY